MSNKDIVELKPELKTFVAACDVDANKWATLIVEAESYPAIALQMTEIEFAAARKYLAPVGEHRHIEHAYYMPAVFGVQNQTVVIVEAERQEPSQILRPANDGLHIERYGLAAIRISERGLGAQGKHPHLVKEPDVLLSLKIYALEIVQVQL